MLVVGRDRPEAGDQLLDERLLVDQERRVDRALLPDRRVVVVVGVARSTGPLAQKLPKPCVGCSRVLGVERPERAGAGPLGAREVAREQVPEQVGPSDGALQEAAAAEQRARVAVGGAAGEGEEGLVVPGVARGGDHPDVEPADADHVAVANTDPFEVHGLVGGEQVVGAVSSRQAEGARHVVVVQVGVCDGRDVDLRLGRCSLDDGEVARRVDHECLGAVVDEVAPVAQLGQVDGDNVHAAPRVLLNV